jgi:hypothetical protein
MCEFDLVCTFIYRNFISIALAFPSVLIMSYLVLRLSIRKPIMVFMVFISRYLVLHITVLFCRPIEGVDLHFFFRCWEVIS